MGEVKFALKSPVLSILLDHIFVGMRCVSGIMGWLASFEFLVQIKFFVLVQIGIKSGILTFQNQLLSCGDTYYVHIK